LGPDADAGMLAERLRRGTAGGGVLLIGWLGAEAVGHVYIWTDRPDEPEIHERLPDPPLIMNLWVRPERRRQGIGVRLMAAAEKWLAERGHDKVALGVDTENEAAILLYRHLGYSPWGHGDVKTHRDHFQADGSVDTVTWEICEVFYRDLPKMRRPARSAPFLRLVHRIREISSRMTATRMRRKVDTA
jgi:GNAT superfamily N-acetyltransferase